MGFFIGFAIKVILLASSLFETLSKNLTVWLSRRKMLAKNITHYISRK
jgi:hypothetical protein